MTELMIPDGFWDGNLEGVLVAWNYDDGAHVTEGTGVAEIAVEKSQMELIAPCSGILRQKMAVDTTVRPGDVIGTIA